MAELRAGVGRANLTPAIGASLVGFRGRASGCTSVHDDLYATALVLESGDQSVAIVSCDLISVHPEIVGQVRELVRSSTGIPGDHVAICCSHTHSGPPGYATARSHAIDRSYAAYLPYKLAGAVRLAHTGLVPARMGYGGGAATIGINRREVIGEGKTILGNNPDGPVDSEVGVLRVDTRDGEPLATVANYACHPVILGPRSTVVSADYVGQTRQVVEAATGAPMLFLQGACGDINPLGGVTAEYTNCEELGTILGEEVARVHGEIRPVQADTRLAAHRLDLELPLRPLPEQEAPLTQAVELREIRDKEFPWDVPIGETGPRTEIQALALGDLAIATVAAEPFVETGLAVKSESRFARTFFAGYANGCVGYMPTAQAYPHRGYEVSVAHLLYGVPDPVAPEAEGIVVRACIDSLSMVGAELPRG